MNIDRTHKQYLIPEDVDQLARQNANLTAELWIVKDRLAVLEHLLQQKGILDAGDVDDYEPKDALEVMLEDERAAYVERVIGIDPSERTVERLKRRAIRGRT